jgi:hypothetical protein
MAADEIGEIEWQMFVHRVPAVQPHSASAARPLREHG